MFVLPTQHVTFAHLIVIGTYLYKSNKNTLLIFTKPYLKVNILYYG